MPMPKEKGKFKITHILVAGTAQKSDTGTYYLEWREGGKRHQRPIGTDARAPLKGIPATIITDAV